jgi:C-1 hydroxylase
VSLEKNKAIIRKYETEAINKRKIEMLDEIMAPDYVDHPLQLRGREANKQAFAMNIKAFPDWHETIEDMIAEGDKVWLRFKATGTHKGELRGVLAPSRVLAPTGKKITIRGVVIYRMVNGKLVEKESAVYDFLDFYKQLGIIEYTEKGKQILPKEV